MEIIYKKAKTFLKSFRKIGQLKIKNYKTYKNLFQNIKINPYRFSTKTPTAIYLKSAWKILGILSQKLKDKPK